MFFFTIILFLTSACAIYSGPSSTSNLLNPDKEPCLRCICHANSACFDLKKCAEKTINYTYWMEAGSLGVDNADNSYEKCMENESCILNTIDAYTTNVVMRINDIDCDGIVDCRDYLAAHMFGMNAKEASSVIKIPYAKRFDRCEGHGPGNVTETNWKGKICIAERNHFY